MRIKHAIIVVAGIFIILQPLSAQTWKKTRRLGWTSGSSQEPRVAMNPSNNIHLVWRVNYSGNWEVYYWKMPLPTGSYLRKRLTWNIGSSSHPTIAVDAGGNIHVVWGDDRTGNTEIYYKKSTNGGTSWTTKRLTWTSGGSICPLIKTDSNNHIHVVWTELKPGNHDIYYNKSTDGGASWTAKRLTWNSWHEGVSAITTDSNNHIHVVYNMLLSSNWEIYYKKSTDGGVSWTTKRLTNNSAASLGYGIATDSSDNVHVVCIDETPGNREIYYMKSTNGGSSWTTKRLTWNSASVYTPAIATDSSDNIHVVWEKDAPGEIYYKRSTDGGIVWTTKRLTWNPGLSGYPGIATDSNNRIHVFWHDNTHGFFAIYYKEGVQ